MNPTQSPSHPKWKHTNRERYNCQLTSQIWGKFCCSFLSPNLLLQDICVSILTTLQWLQWSTKEILLTSASYFFNKKKIIFLWDYWCWIKDWSLFKRDLKHVYENSFCLQNTAGMEPPQEAIATKHSFASFQPQWACPSLQSPSAKTDTSPM